MKHHSQARNHIEIIGHIFHQDQKQISFYSMIEKRFLVLEVLNIKRFFFPGRVCQLEQSIFTVTFTLQNAQGPVRVESYGLRGTIYADEWRRYTRHNQIKFVMIRKISTWVSVFLVIGHQDFWKYTSNSWYHLHIYLLKI